MSELTNRQYNSAYKAIVFYYGGTTLAREVLGRRIRGGQGKKRRGPDWTEGRRLVHQEAAGLLRKNIHQGSKQHPFRHSLRNYEPLTG